MPSSKGPKQVLLRDIAEATGYTVNTVSRALKNKPDIADSTCEYIQSVADQMGYVRNSIASSLRTGRTRTISVIVGDIANPFFAGMINLLHDAAQKIGYSVLVLCSRDDSEQEEKAVITSIERRVDGVLLFPTIHCRTSIKRMQQAHIPFVLVSRHTQNIDYDYVVCDDEKGGYLATKHLIEAGHRKLAFYCRNEVIYSSRGRYQGMLRAAAEAGIPQENVVSYLQGDTASLSEKLHQWKSTGVTGIFAFCDLEVWQLIAQMETDGMLHDFSIVGFDNIQSMLEYPYPLCTIDGGMEKQISTAVDLLMKRIHGDTSPPRAVVYDVKLVCRGSCRHAFSKS
ncbi:MAG TPA: LacI family DNA-binding transcriptional regulator [Candidatus Limiplasma sp.]|nr:LacI family DNA-binding transcriptional regulator [Candidatus Limiplasma sp.]